MLMQNIFGRGDFALLNEFRSPLLAFALALVLALGGRWMKSAMLCAAATGVGIAAGWYLMAGNPFTLNPRLPVDRLVPVALAALAILLLAARFAATKGIWPPLILTALLTGWWLAGGPRNQPDAIAAWPIVASAAATVLIAGWIAGRPGADPLRPAMAGAVLAASLYIAAAPWVWVLLALVPAAAALPMLFAPRMLNLVLLPPLTAIAATAVLAVLNLGRLPKGAFKLADAAALSPLLALILLTPIATRLRFAGQLGPFLAAMLSGGIAVAAIWGLRAGRLL